ncbi:ECF-type sigma factor [Wenzhouxiangella marina]|uniref:ECF subfamily RNA polymerase sigma-24 factor n=1 Tax=Wenzhouxiangella marina TaxID=1579979 RepID=A0A0K0XXD1_9GAMM|nr:ECF-type sigma factor [Wenzhouxiangella marina]AKS42287.1 ECF subfamily RNA polymerase sigma-24 factor [Wenzhouxiangella marina]MBB6085940.1 RNA polymerase sigma factor (TIGR02999 family) [Wenzhouxiangella marina]
MSSDKISDVTQLLKRYSDTEDAEGLYDMLPMVYQELRALAGRQLASQGRDHTLQATALINEAYLRLADQDYHSWENRRQFLLVASTVMRRVLVDYARRRSAAKRPEGQGRVALETDELGEEFGTDLIALDQVLEQLAEVDPRQASIVELRYFAGLSVPDTAETLEISERTVVREWRMARAWLKRKLA